MFLEIAFLHFIILFELGFYLSKAVCYFPRKEVSQTFIDRDVYPGFDGFTPCLLFFFKEKLFDFRKVGVQSETLLPACMRNNFLLTYFPLFKVSYQKFILKVWSFLTFVDGNLLHSASGLNKAWYFCMILQKTLR